MKKNILLYKHEMGFKIKIKYQPGRVAIFYKLNETDYIQRIKDGRKN